MSNLPSAACRFLYALLAVIVPLAVRPAVAQQLDLDRLEDLVRAEMIAWNVPGLGLAVVHGDSVLMAKGFGIRDVARPQPVDDATLFAIGSTTKAFTAAAAALLVGTGRLDWEDRAAGRLPGFALRDPYATREITLRDLLAHRSGLPMANLMWLTGLHDREALLDRVRHLEPASSFRSRFGYQNVLYLAAGEIIGRAAGTGWSEFVTERLFAPLGMSRSRTSRAGLAGDGNVASPHVRVGDGVRPVPPRDIDAIGPAGSIHSSAGDMARWLVMQLGDGTVRGRRIIDAEALAETRRSQIPLRVPGLERLYPFARSVSYAMGWVVSDYRDRTLLDHGGGIDGMTALVALMPEEDLGVAILTNVQLRTPLYWLLYPLLDQWLGAAPDDWSGRFRQAEAEIDAFLAAERPRAAGTRPALVPAGYTGRYRSAPLGEVVVGIEDGALAWRFGHMSGRLEHWHHDTFRVHWTSVAWTSAAGPGWLTFRLGADGAVADVVLEATPGERWTFERLPEVARGAR